MTKPSDAAWRCILRSGREGTRGKVLRMSAPTLAAILRDRGERVPGPHVQTNPDLNYRRLYDIRVVLDDFMRLGAVELGRE